MEEREAWPYCCTMRLARMVVIYILAAIGAYVVVRKVYDMWEEIHYNRVKRKQRIWWDEDDD